MEIEPGRRQLVKGEMCVAEDVKTMWPLFEKFPFKSLCSYCPNYEAEKRLCLNHQSGCSAGSNLVWVREVEWVALKLDGL
jgi:hypothetical protein